MFTNVSAVCEFTFKFGSRFKSFLHDQICLDSEFPACNAAQRSQMYIDADRPLIVFSACNDHTRCYDVITGSDQNHVCAICRNHSMMHDASVRSPSPGDEMTSWAKKLDHHHPYIPVV